MAFIKGADDHSGYGIASDGTSATLTSASEDGAVEITIPEMWDGVPLRKISFGAFRGNSDLVKITLPDTVTTIDSNAFRACPHLETVVLSRGLKNLAPHAFSNNKNLKSVTIPSTVMSFNAMAFEKCPHLTEFKVYDMNTKEKMPKRFVVAAINESRRISYMNASMIYFDSYNMRKYDEGYSVLAEYEDRFNIAVFRLSNPEQLDDFMRREYENEIYQSIPRIIKNDQIDKLTAAGELGIIHEDKFQEYFDLAGEIQGDCMAYLLQYRENHFAAHSLDFYL